MLFCACSINAISLAGEEKMNLSMQKSFRRIVLSIAIVVGVVALIAQRSYADQIPTGWKASNMKPIGYTGLNGLGEAFKMTIKHVNDHWYLYLGHYDVTSGWSIVDVTDPTNPKYVKWIQGPDNTGTYQMEMHDNIMITSLQRASAEAGADPNKPYDEGVLIWDMSDPVNPKLLSHWKTGSTGVHRIGYPGGKYANLAANMPGFRGQILVFLDISDPKNPKEAGRWWEPGQKEGEPMPDSPISFHGPAIIDGNKAYVGYSNEIVILDISNIASPKVIGKLQVWPPFHGGIPVHDVLPIPGKNLLFAHSEETSGDTPKSPPCSQPLSLVGMIDIKDETKPRLISIFPRPVPPAGEAYTDFCDKGGRFGPHNTNLEQHLPDVEKQADLIYLTYFNGGLRIFDIKNPRAPKEVGWFVPPLPTKRAMPIPMGKLVDQTEDVLVDTRGNIYITDKQWGVFILRYTGPGEPAPTAK
jgi:hypothetical protein